MAGSVDRHFGDARLSPRKARSPFVPVRSRPVTSRQPASRLFTCFCLDLPPLPVCLSAYDRPDDAHTSACTRVRTRAYSLLSFFNYYSVLFTGIKISGRVVRPTIGQSHVVLASRYVRTRKGLFPPTFLRLSRSIWSVWCVTLSRVDEFSALFSCIPPPLAFSSCFWPRWQNRTISVGREGSGLFF